MTRFLKIVSFVFQPLLITSYGMIWMCQLEAFAILPAFWRTMAMTGTFVFTCLIPAIPIIVLMWKGEISDIFIHKKEQRTLPYLFSLLSYIFWALFLFKILHLPMSIAIMGFGSVLSLVLMTLINIKWKISAHLCSMGALLGFVCGVSYSLAINPSLFIAVLLCVTALVALSRIELKAHTPLQTLAGFVLGFLCVFLASYWANH